MQVPFENTPAVFSRVFCHVICDKNGMCCCAYPKVLGMASRKMCDESG
jgi:hypothetical protein